MIINNFFDKIKYNLYIIIVIIFYSYNVFAESFNTLDTNKSIENKEDLFLSNFLKTTEEKNWLADNMLAKYRVPNIEDGNIYIKNKYNNEHKHIALTHFRLPVQTSIYNNIAVNAPKVDFFTTLAISIIDFKIEKSSDIVIRGITDGAYAVEKLYGILGGSTDNDYIINRATWNPIKVKNLSVQENIESTILFEMRWPTNFNSNIDINSIFLDKNSKLTLLYDNNNANQLSISNIKALKDTSLALGTKDSSQKIHIVDIFIEEHGKFTVTKDNRFHNNKNTVFIDNINFARNTGGGVLVSEVPIAYLNLDHSFVQVNFKYPFNVNLSEAAYLMLAGENNEIKVLTRSAKYPNNNSYITISGFNPNIKVHIDTIMYEKPSKGISNTMYFKSIKSYINNINTEISYHPDIIVEPDAELTFNRLSDNTVNPIALNDVLNKGTLDIQDRKVSIDRYVGTVGSRLSFYIKDINEKGDNEAQLSAQLFSAEDGDIYVGNMSNQELDNKDYTLIKAEKLILTKNVRYLYQDIHYTIEPEITKDNIVKIKFNKTNFLNYKDGMPIKTISNNSNSFLHELQKSLSDNKVVNQEKNTELQYYIADNLNREKNTNQIYTISSTTRKEFAKLVSDKFNSTVMDKNIYDIHNTQGFNLWISEGYEYASIKENNQIKNVYKTSMMQSTLGASYIDNNILLGGALGFGIIRNKSQNSEVAKLDIKSMAYNGSIYGGYKYNIDKYHIHNIYSISNISYGLVNNNHNKVINASYGILNITNKNKDMIFTVLNESGIVIGDKVKINPYINNGYKKYDVGKYKESGSVFSSSMETQKYADITTEIGSRFSSAFKVKEHTLTPIITLSYEWKLNNDSNISEVNFSNIIGNSIMFEDAGYSKGKIHLQAALGYQYSDRIIIDISLNTDYNNEVFDVGGKFNISYKF